MTTEKDPNAGAGAFSQATGRSLEDSSGADQRRYRAFQLEMIEPHCGPSVLEVGAGLGEFAAQFRGLRRHVVTDVDPDCVASMAERFRDRPEVSARQLDLTRGAIDLEEPVSTIVAINVLEHIEDDAGALRALASMVEPGGRIVLWVPGYEQLYGDFDRAGMTPDVGRRVNRRGGIAGGRPGPRGVVGPPRPGLVRFYDRFVVPVTRFAERRVVPPFGQSVLAVAVVPD